MHLRKIEISGFKSFMNGLELQFSSGITAILGPNGCGKSNVVDAIRWVLGEQRTRLLRNTKMENVIFNGTRLRKPLGMAEVNMVLTNEDHGLSVDYEEVRIGRRLFRSGASDYLLNGETTRLKSIKSLLVDTGLGNHAYSIIERDMVDRVLSEKEHDKRNLLEEAAGIMRYRLQREEAERKIKATEQDLLRLGDILEELEKEIRSLKYQMAKARRFQRLKDELDALETVMLKSTLFSLLEKTDALHQEREEHENIRLTDTNEISVRESRLQEVRIETSETERRLQDLHEERYATSSSLQQQEEKIAVHTERINSSRARIEEDTEEVRRAKEKLDTLGTELEAHESEVTARRDDLEAVQSRLSTKESDLSSLSQRLDEARTTLRDRKQIALDLVKEKAKETGLREHLQQSADDLAGKQAEIESQLSDLADEEGRMVAELSAAESAVDAQRDRVAQLDATLASEYETLESVATQSAECDAQLAKADRAAGRVREKIEFLERIKREHTKWTDETLRKHAYLRGALSDFVRVDKRFRKCFEACLAPVIGGVVAGSHADAVASIDGLRDDAAGKVQIVFPGWTKHPAKLPELDGVIDTADKLVEADGEAGRFLYGYLSDVLVVEDTDVAARVMSNGNGFRVATLDGIFFDGPGRIVVAGPDDVDVTLLEYDTKLGELASLCESADADVARLSERRDDLAGKRQAAQERIADCRGRRDRLAEALESLSARRRDTEITLVRVKEKITSLEQSFAELSAAASEVKARLAAAENRPPVDDDPEEMDLSELEAAAARLEIEKDTLTETVNKMRLERVAAAGELETLTAKIKNAQKLQEELQQLIRAREEDAMRCREQIRLSEEDIAGLREKIATLHGEKDRIEAEIEKVTELHDGQKEKADALEAEIKAMKDTRDSKRENLERISVELATVEERISGVIEKARDNFHQDLSPLVKNRELFDPSEWEDFDRARLDEVREKLDKFGPVNMLALEEFEEKNERFEFLTKQHEDLVEAKHSLTQAIRRINKEARRLFLETFEQVRDNFKQTFLTLFDGGEVELLLTDSDDPLQANIKIVANPKGKRLHDISSLSSGERALVALSLLFAIYLVKPSPFCVFDEVDAPLDDANIARFVRLLKSFTDRTQFIVITHNKKTMEAADNLYGVTMEEPGVSKLISIHLDEAERFKAHHPAAAKQAAEAGAASPA